MATKASVDRLHERQDKRERDEEDQKILDWLTPLDYASQQSDFLDRRQEGTGEWLLQSGAYLTWVNGISQTLLCTGMPGAGKTILTAIVIDDLYKRSQNDDITPTSIAYVYCNFRRQEEQKPELLMASLLKQFVQVRAVIPKSLKDLYGRHERTRSRTRPTLQEISKVLASVLSTCPRAFIIIDALDEFQVSDGARTQFLSEVFALQTNTGVRLFATSRIVREIQQKFQLEKCAELEIRASADDVKRYLENNLYKLPSFVSKNLGLQKEITKTVAEAVEGMFLLAELYLSSLVGKKSPKALRTALQKLPSGSAAYDVAHASGSKAYDSAYNQAIDRIDGQVIDSQLLAKQVLSCAQRPLTTEELRHTLAVEVGEPVFDEENLPEIEDMVSVCAGLVTIDEESDIIRLVHHTAQEYFVRMQIRLFPTARVDIAQICIIYLLFETFKSGVCSTSEEYLARLQSNILYDYAALNWGYHARVVFDSNEVKEAALDLLESANKAASSHQVEIARSGYFQHAPRQITGLHLAAYFELGDAMIDLLMKGYAADAKDSNGRTPLSWAAYYGCEASVKLLLARLKGDIDVNSKDPNGRTPLWFAAVKGHDAVVKLLLAVDSVDPDSSDFLGFTPLMKTVDNGHEAVVELLLAADGVNLNPKTNDGQTPLSRAAEEGNEALMKLLLAKDGVELNSKNEYGRTPISKAAGMGNEAVVKLLLAKDGVDPDPNDGSGQTPLRWAAAMRHEGVVKLLLAKEDVNPDFRTRKGESPLSEASAHGHEAIVKLLLAKHGVDPDSKTNVVRHRWREQRS